MYCLANDTLKSLTLPGVCFDAASVKGKEIKAWCRFLKRPIRLPPFLTSTA